MHFQDSLASFDVRAIQDDATVETAGSQQRWIEHIGAVGGGDDDNIGIRAKAIHLDQDLIQGLLALIVRSAQPGTPVAPHGVDLVDKDDARRIPLGLVEEIPYAGCTHTHKHLHEFGSRDGEEGDARLARYRLGQQGFARSWWAHQHYTFGDARPQGNEFLWLPEKLDHFDQLLLGFLNASHVVKGDRWFLTGEHPRPAFAEGERLVVRSLRLSHQEDEKYRQEYEGQKAAQNGDPFSPGIWRLDLKVDLGQLRGGHSHGHQGFRQINPLFLA